MAHAIASFRVTDPDTNEVRMYRPGNEIDARDLAEARARGAASGEGATVESKAMKPKENK